MILVTPGRCRPRATDYNLLTVIKFQSLVARMTHRRICPSEFILAISLIRGSICNKWLFQWTHLLIVFKIQLDFTEIELFAWFDGEFLEYNRFSHFKRGITVDGSWDKSSIHKISLGIPVDTVVIKTSDSSYTEASSESNTESLSTGDIIQKVEDAGLVGMGGATFPTNVKLSPPPEKT